MKLHFRLSSLWLILLLSLAVSHVAVAADRYPNQIVRIICVYPAGGGLDIVMRAIAQRLSQAWGRPVVVENQASAGTTLGTAIVAKAAPDGHTLLATDVSFSITASLYAKLSYDPRKDLAPISMFAAVSQALVVNPSLPVHSIGDLIAYAKANPGKVLYGTSGVGTSPQLNWARLNKTAELNTVNVPYKGAVASGLTDIVAGRIQVYSGATGNVVPYVQSGQLRALAVFDSRRTKVLPGVPAIAEAGLPGLEINAWYGLFAPAGTPREIVDQVYQELARTLTAAEIQQALATLGNEPLFGIGPEEFTTFLRSDLVKWEDAVRTAGVRVE